MERSIVFIPSMTFGFEVYFADSVETFVEDLKRARPTIFASVPRLWLKFKAGVEAKMPPKKLKRLLRVPILRGVVRKKTLWGLGLDAARISGTGSAPLPKEVLEWYRDLGLEFLGSFGMSEFMGLAALSRPGKSKPGTLGPALPGSRILSGRERPERQARAPVEARRNPDSWEIADGLLTPTMKIKRSAIEARYDARAKQ